MATRWLAGEVGVSRRTKHGTRGEPLRSRQDLPMPLASLALLLHRKAQLLAGMERRLFRCQAQRAETRAGCPSRTGAVDPHHDNGCQEDATGSLTGMRESGAAASAGSTTGADVTTDSGPCVPVTVSSETSDG